MQEINIVWLKRDVRTQDHVPLYLAERSSLPYLIIYIFEPSLIQYPDTSLRHLQFIYHSLEDFNRRMAENNKSAEMFFAEAEDVFGYLCSMFQIQNIFSYQESGIQITWDRDKRIKRLFTANHIQWKESQRDGVLRGIHNRQGWDAQWKRSVVSTPVVQNRYSPQEAIAIDNRYPIVHSLHKQWVTYPEEYQPAGESYAWKYLYSFVKDRGHTYHKTISKPTESRTSCSRLSPYIAWGNISIRQVYQYIQNCAEYRSHRRAFNGLLTRLKWHCHFIQKFEVECSYETKCINKGYETLSHDGAEDAIIAWKEGRTGYPLVDACMRCLHATGWINFRMRAMLVSFFCHHMDQDWRGGVYHLAQLFLDYEPGIHYPQFQMQAGTTGVNTIRMYNPVKQSQDHDPKGYFIKKWVPELSTIELQHLHTPWKMTLMEQQLSQVTIGIDYPFPIVELESSGRTAREKIWGHRKNALVQKENRRIINTHTRNR